MAAATPASVAAYLDMVANQIKGITGKANWYTAAVRSLESFVSGAAGAVLRLGTSDAFDLVLRRNAVDKVTVGAAGVTLADPLLAPAGTLALPAYSFSGDPNTGIYNSAADELSVATGGVAHWIMRSSGHLEPTPGNAKDIGTDESPVRNFYIQGVAQGPIANPERFRHKNMMARVSKSVSQMLTTGVEAALTWDTEDFDLGALHDNVTNNDRLTAPIAGKYVATVVVPFAANATGERYVIIITDGGVIVAYARISAGAANVRAVTVTTPPVHLAAAGWMQAKAYQDSGGNLDVLNAQAAFGMMYVGE